MGHVNSQPGPLTQLSLIWNQTYKKLGGDRIEASYRKQSCSSTLLFFLHNSVWSNVHSGGVVDAWRSESLEILYSKLMSRMLELALPSIIPSSCSLPRIASSGLNWKIVRKLVIVNASQEWTSERDPRSQVQLINADRIESQGRNEPGKRLLINRFRV